VSGTEALGDDQVERRAARVRRVEAEQPGRRGVPEHDAPVRVGDDDRVGEVGHERRERRRREPGRRFEHRRQTRRLAATVTAPLVALLVAVHRIVHRIVRVVRGSIVALHRSLRFFE
jgi:hypothetical protein